MDKDHINNQIKLFLQNIDKTKHNDDIISQWFSDENQNTVFGKNKKVTKSHKSAYLCFCDSERERLRNLDPPVVKRSEVHSIMSSRWNTLKEQGGVEYDNFVKLSNLYNNKVAINSDYEITKPYHKFCSENRGKIVDKFPLYTAKEITMCLSSEWNKLNKEEKKHWII